MPDDQLRGLDPTSSPCIAHSSHRPAPWVSEAHHVIPLAWTNRLGLPQSRTIPVCPTGHDQIHRAVAARIAGRRHRRLDPDLEPVILEALAFYRAHPDRLAGAPLTQAELDE